MRSATECVPAELLGAFVTGGLAADDLAQVEEHLLYCAECRSVLGALDPQSGSRRTLRASAQTEQGAPAQSHERAGAGARGGRGAPPRFVWTPPSQIGEFSLVRRLGAGSFGQVWLARDVLLDRPVALKIALGETSETMRLRFHVEARAMARLRHPNLVTLHHFGEIAERPYIVTELLVGRALTELELPVAPARVVAMGIDLVRGLRAAHRAGVLHRDIKPANAFLCDDGTTKLLDFGLAKLADSAADHVTTAASLGPGAEGFNATLTARSGLPPPPSPALYGTPLYMAPEIWRGETASTCSDVYSLGALLFELLAGRRAFAATTFQELRASVLAGARADLANLAPATPGPLVDVVVRCLSLDPARRPEVDDMCRALELLGERAMPAVSSTDPAEPNPYRGLLAFGPEHSSDFFGREAETAEIVAELRANPFVLVVGPSGVGKSSLVRAGVAPRIARSDGRRVLVMSPGSRALDALALQMAPVLGLDEAEVIARLAESPGWLAGQLGARRERVLLVVDQLEQVWTLSPARDRAAFFGAIAGLVEAGTLSRVVATLRADFLPRLDDMGQLQAHALRAPVVLRALTPEALRRAIIEPARRRGAAIAPEVVERLTAGLKDGSLPLVEFALAALWERREATLDVIGAKSLDALGGVSGALAAHADQALERMPAGARQDARRLLLALVTVERTSARRERKELLEGGTESASEALEILIEARLVVVGSGGEGPVYELAHEALLSDWPTLRRWIEEESVAREASERLHRAAAEWKRLGRPTEALFGTHQLRENDVLEGRPIEPGADAFLRASRTWVRRGRTRRRMLRFGAPVGAALLAGAAAAGIHGIERRDAHAFVAARLAEAELSLRRASALDREIEAARNDAFSRFDAGDDPAGEARWQEALALGGLQLDAFAAGSLQVDRARARDPQDGRARVVAADLIVRWFLATEREHQPELASELLARLGGVDDDGSRRARLAAPARLRVATLPPEAEVHLRRVRFGADGRAHEEELSSLDRDATVDLEPGSYVLAASAAGRYPTRYPVLLSRGQDVRVEIPLPDAGAVPAGFVYVPGGVTLVGLHEAEGERLAAASEPEHPVRVSAFLISRHEVTFAEYLAFLNAQDAHGRAEHTPRAVSDEFVALAFENSGEPVLTIGRTTAKRGELLCRPKRNVRRCQDWLRFPVTGVSREDARAYARWLAARGVPGARLCSDREWERAARGGDGRIYPQGDAMLPGDANFAVTYSHDADQMGVDEVESFPLDVSPFGVNDLGGNVSEWVDAAVIASGEVRGGHWREIEFYSQVTVRRLRIAVRQDDFGIRVCASLTDAP
jgi:serine/threonine protein kinase/formylglycine-generating enzyme required for sulfatase activity